MFWGKMQDMGTLWCKACLALIGLTALLCTLFSVNSVLNIYNFDETTTKALAEVWPEVSAGLNVQPICQITKIAEALYCLCKTNWKIDVAIYFQSMLHYILLESLEYVSCLASF